MTNLVLRCLYFLGLVGRPYPNCVLLIDCPAARRAFAAGAIRRNGGGR